LVGVLLAVILLVGAIVPAATTLASAAADKHSSHVSKTKKKKAAKKKATKKKKAKKKKAKKKASTTTPAAAPSAAACTKTPAAIDAAGKAFMAHVKSAHLEQTPAEQAADFADPDAYAKLHTIWLESVIEPVAAALTGPSLKAFMAHVNSAHLQKSPLEQVTELSAIDKYIKLHTVWLQGVLAPLLEESGCETPSAPSGGGGAAPTKASVMIMDYVYSPGTVSVPAGSKVTWMNHDSDAHTVTSKGGGPLSSSNMAKNGTYEYTFASPGTFEYFCAIHPQMKGAVTVQ
jgi:plastocyanin